MEELIPINILIGDRSYRIKSEAKDEEAIRSTVKLIHDKIMDFRSQFAGKDMQDYIAMVLIWFATQPSGNKPSLEEKTILESLRKLESVLDKKS
jgi:cell division protein ZapA